MRIVLDAAALPLAPGVAEVAAALGRRARRARRDRRRGLRAAASASPGASRPRASPGSARSSAGPPEVTWRGAPPGADGLAGLRARLVAPVAHRGASSSSRRRLRIAAATASLSTVYVPHSDALSQLLHFGHRTVLGRGRRGRAHRSAAHRREPDPSSGLASRIGYPAPSYESHRRRADNGRWGRRRISSRGASRRRSVQAARTRRFAWPPSTADGRRRGSAGRRHALGHPDGGRRHDPRALDAVGEAAVGHHEHDLVARAQLVDAAERRAVGRAVPGDARPCRAGRAAACRDSGRGRRAGRRRPCPPRPPTRARCGRSRSRPIGSPSSVRRSSERAAKASRRVGSGRRVERALLDRGRADAVQRRELALQLALLPRARRARTPAPATAASRRRRPAAACPRRSARSTARAARARPRRCGCAGAVAHRRSADSVPPSEPGPA